MPESQSTRQSLRPLCEKLFSRRERLATRRSISTRLKAFDRAGLFRPTGMRPEIEAAQERICIDPMALIFTTIIYLAIQIMAKQYWLVLLSFVLIVGVGVALAQTQTSQTKDQVPDVSGEWTGVWSAYNPAQGGGSPKELCKNLTAKVVSKDGAWEAIFEGDCGRPYKYTIKMEGRQVGKVVMFKGTTDLGAKDGGVYDWIGRVNDKEFVGFFTSAYYTGTFNLSRSK